MRNDIERWSEMNSPLININGFNSPDEFVLDVCNKINIDFLALCAQTRKRDVVLMRYVCLSICSVYDYKHKKRWGLKNIGGVFGLNYATVVHGKKVITSFIETNRLEYVDYLEDISSRYNIELNEFIKYKNFFI